MKKTDALMKVTAILLFAAMLCYLGLNLYRRASDPVQTALAVTATVSDSASMSGIAVRREQVVESAEPYIEVTASEGEKIAAGGTVATVYPSAGALERALQLRTLASEISRMSAALKAQTGGSTVNRDESVYSALCALSGDVRSGDFSDAEPHASVLEGLLFQTDTEISQENLTALQTQYQDLAEASAGETIVISAAEGGTFSSVVDGYEELTPEAVSALTPDALRNITTEARSIPKNAVGKLVTSYRWYYTAVMDTAAAASLAVGDVVNLSMERYYSGLLSARVETLGAVSGSEQTVMFSMNLGLTELLAARFVSAELVFTNYTGLRVPQGGLWRYWAGMLPAADAARLSPGDDVTLSLGGRLLNAFVSEVSDAADEQGRCQAVFCWAWEDTPTPDGTAQGMVALADGTVLTAEPYYDDGQERLCVFTMTGLQAERKKVVLVYGGREFCLVSSAGDDALREGNEIILSAAELYNGRVFD